MPAQRRGGGRQIPRLFREVGLEHQVSFEARHLSIILLGTVEGFRTSRDEAAEGGGWQGGLSVPKSPKGMRPPKAGWQGG